MNKRTNLRLLLIFVVIGLMISPAFAEETTINLDPSTPYIDVPVEATAPTQITIETTTGTPQTNPGFIDSWIELWQGVNKLFANDDGAHSATNVLASYISAPIEAGTYFIRATSFAWMASNQTQTPTGSYVLTWNGVTTVQTTPTPTPEPTPTETINPTPTTQPTIEPTEHPSPIPTATDSSTPTPTQEPQPEPQPESNTNNQENAPILTQETPTPTPDIIQPETLETEPEIVEQIVEEQTSETPIVVEESTPEEIQEQIDAQYIEQNTIELSLPTALDNIPGAAEVFAAAEAVLNVGSDMTEEQREESQSVVVASIILTQIASVASLTSRRIK